MKTILNVPINNRITAEELRVIDDNGENIGVMTRDAALALAKEKGLDLIQISATAKPPVARIMSFDKYRYQEEKKLKKQKVAQKGGEFKQVQIGVKTALNDLQIKAKKLNDFLSEGHVVEIFLVMRGREKANRDFAMEKMRSFLTIINPQHKLIMTPRFTGKGIAAQVSK